ncbi:hypothetical protein [Herbaspirillum robiniae]|uniref:hypothetical protein n=1 Tax=Herbaspirillum robiniae TaxID=2014887 RepID=UPI003D789A1E
MITCQINDISRIKNGSMRQDAVFTQHLRRGGDGPRRYFFSHVDSSLAISEAGIGASSLPATMRANGRLGRSTLLPQQAGASPAVCSAQKKQFPRDTGFGRTLRRIAPWSKTRAMI